MPKTKGQLEAQISAEITRFEKEYLGRGPRESKSFLIDDMVIIRLRGVLTPAEESLATEEGGAQLIKQMRMRLIESSEHLLIEIIEKCCGVDVLGLLTDINPITGERVFVFSLSEKLFD